MKNTQKTARKIALGATIALLTLVGCQKSELETTAPTTGISFDLHTENNTKTTQKAELHAVEFYVTNPDDTFTTGIKTKYDQNRGQIIIEGLKNGNYTLHIMAADGDPADNNAQLHTLQKITDQWLTFNDTEIKALNHEYFHKSHNFEIINGELAQPQNQITLTRIVGQCNINVDYTTQYIQKITTKFEIIPQTTYVYSQFNGKASPANPKPLAKFEIKNKTNFITPPSAPQNGKITLRHHTQEHNKGQKYFNDYIINTQIQQNTTHNITLELNHPLKNHGIIYHQDTTKFPQILLDGESHTYVNNRAHRQFHPGHPLQIKTIKNNAGTKDSILHTRFYSVMAVGKVTIWARPTGYTEDIEIAHFDTIPQLGEYFAKLPKGPKNWKTKSGKIVTLDITTTGLDGFYNQSQDPYMQKIYQIANSSCNWNIGFSNFGADPTTGAPSGQWQVMSAKYARAAIAVLTNMAHQFSNPAFHEFCLTFQGRIFANDKVTPVNMSTICEDFLLKGTINAGATTSYGLAGGNTWGITTGQYFTHFTSPWAADTAFHELAHCLGYSHDSCMASYGTGLWCAHSVAKETCALGFYHANIESSPVPNVDCLTIKISSTNPSQYTE